ncbi:unnamed protein product [Rotaria sordida]|uniref:Uncharacterized protein n=1 Tax=Rotaria sordida TaxID=392033 RepID=A0A815N0K1_9BILA|nr:unnamed protein product [Rotaria sordida]CAF1631141.1 unnamed protein product [Rotaria sordida]
MTLPNISAYFCSNCQQECSTNDYPVKTSSASAPPDWLIDQIKVFVGNSLITLPSDWSTSWRTHIQNSYVAIDVVRESMLVEKYTQQATMSGVDLLSNVGGQTGLWIGISFLSLVEVAEMIYRLIRYQYHFFYDAHRKETPIETIHEQN